MVCGCNDSFGATMPIEKHQIVDRGQWLAMRLADLTASDVAAAVGRSPWKTQLALYAEKTGLIDMPPAGPLARRGLWLEPAGIAAVPDEHPGWGGIRHNQYFPDPQIRLRAPPAAPPPNAPDVPHLPPHGGAKPRP